MDQADAQAVTVVLVDDHPVVLSGLSFLLGEFDGIEVVGTAATGAEAVAACTRLRPDILVLDLRIPGPAGPAVVKTLAEVSPRTAVVILSTEITARDLEWATETGVRGFVLKGDDPGQIAAAIRRVHDGGTFVSAELSGALLELSRPSRARATDPTFTERELAVLQHLVHGASNRQIARALSVSERTVKAHLTSVFGKLDVRDRTGAVAAAIRLHVVDLDA
ncbi:MAG: response regulator transcription factor [Nocardioidaceae bacterium]|nr:response regulator transcription factor [Nocardioidaceae bacterium]